MSQQGLVLLQVDASGLRHLDQEYDREVILLKVLFAFVCSVRSAYKSKRIAVGVIVKPCQARAGTRLLGR